MKIKSRSIVECNHCHSVIESVHRHDFVTCVCGNVSLDGGLDYTRILANSFNDYTDLSVYVEPGTVLLTKDGRQIGNALVLNVHENGVMFVTDFGNVVDNVTAYEIENWFHIGSPTEIQRWIKANITNKSNMQGLLAQHFMEEINGKKY